MTTVTINPSASAHDAWETGPGVVTLTGEVRVSAGTAWGGLLLPSVGVPKSPNSLTATLYYQASATSHDSPGHTWYAQAADSAAAFTTTTSDISSRTRTTASVADSATDIGNTTYRSVDVSSLISEVVGRSGWASGNNIALIADGGSGDLWIRSYDGGTGVWYVVIEYTSSSPQTVALNTLSAALTAVSLAVVPGARTVTLNALSAALEAIDLTIGAGAAAVALNTLTAALTAVNLAASEGSFTLSIAAGGDDGCEASSGAVTLNTTELYVASIYPQVGLLFRNVAIPAGATVTRAYVKFEIFDANLPNLTIRGQFNPANFAATANNLSGRTKTSEGVVWSGEDTAGTSPDIAAVLNEIVGTEGWTEGDDLALFLIDNGGGGVATYAAYEQAFMPAPQLYVEWTLNPSTDISIPLNTLTGTAAAVALVVAPGAVSQLLDTLAVALLLETAGVAPGGVAQLLDTLSAAASPVALSVAPGAVSLLLDTLSAATAAVTLAPIPGGVAIVLDTHSATLQAVTLSIEGEASYVALNTLTGAVSVVSLGVLPGEAVASLNTLIGLLQVMDVGIGQGIVLATLSAALSAVSAAVVPGAAAVTLATLAPALQAISLAVAPGAVTVDLDTLNVLLALIAVVATPGAVDETILLSSLAAAVSLTDLGVIPGDMLIELQTMAGQLALSDLLVFLMLGYAMHGTRAIGGAATVDYAPLLIRVGDTEGRER